MRTGIKAGDGGLHALHAVLSTQILEVHRRGRQPRTLQGEERL
jgi:hypothetical protein